MIGRNEPCPCGSGRKYKKCCLEKDKAKDIARNRVKLAEGQFDTIMKKVIEFSSEYEKPYKNKCEVDFGITNYELENVMNVYYLVNFKYNKQSSIMLDYLNKNKANINKTDEEIIENTLNSYMSVYQVKEKDINKVLLRDILLNEDLYVEDIDLFRLYKEGEFLLARVVNVGGTKIFLDKTIKISESRKTQIKNDIDNRYKQTKKKCKTKKQCLINNIKFMYQNLIKSRREYIVQTPCNEESNNTEGILNNAVVHNNIKSIAPKSEKEKERELKLLMVRQREKEIAQKQNMKEEKFEQPIVQHGEKEIIFEVEEQTAQKTKEKIKRQIAMPLVEFIKEEYTKEEPTIIQQAEKEAIFEIQEQPTDIKTQELKTDLDLNTTQEINNMSNKTKSKLTKEQRRKQNSNLINKDSKEINEKLVKEQNVINQKDKLPELVNKPTTKVDKLVINKVKEESNTPEKLVAIKDKRQEKPQENNKSKEIIRHKEKPNYNQKTSELVPDKELKQEVNKARELVVNKTQKEIEKQRELVVDKVAEEIEKANELTVNNSQHQDNKNPENMVMKEPQYTHKEKEVAMKKIEDKDKQGKLVMGQAQHEIVADVDYEGVVAIKSNSALVDTTSKSDEDNKVTLKEKPRRQVMARKSRNPEGFKDRNRRNKRLEDKLKQRIETTKRQEEIKARLELIRKEKLLKERELRLKEKELQLEKQLSEITSQSATKKSEPIIAKHMEGVVKNKDCNVEKTEEQLTTRIERIPIYKAEKIESKIENISMSKIEQQIESKIENNIVARLMVEDPPKEKPLLEVTEEKKNLDKNTKEVTNDKKIKKEPKQELKQESKSDKLENKQDKNKKKTKTNKSKQPKEQCKVYDVLISKVEDKYKEQCIKEWKKFKQTYESYTGSENGWAAAIEYEVRKDSDDTVTQGQISKKYNISVKTLSKRYKELKIS